MSFHNTRLELLPIFCRDLIGRETSNANVKCRVPIGSSWITLSPSSSHFAKKMVLRLFVCAQRSCVIVTRSLSPPPPAPHQQQQHQSLCASTPKFHGPPSPLTKGQNCLVFAVEKAKKVTVLREMMSQLTKSEAQ